MVDAKMRVAIVHYWLVGTAGGERVLESLCELFPGAHLFTHVYDPSAVSQTIRSHQVTTTFINSLPKAKTHYQWYLPLMPLALDRLDLREFDLVISSESGPAKGVLANPDATHICYCHSPMRYVWDMYPDYAKSSNSFIRLVMSPLIHYLRLWDRSTADGVDAFVANSRFIAQRIERTYRRESQVIPPPVELPSQEVRNQDDGYYLLLGRLTHYKRADIAVRAFSEAGRRLVVVGDGEQLEELKRIAGPSITITGSLDDAGVRTHLQNCVALVFPGLEDFGIVPVEAMAHGKPVICFGKGGVRDSVIDGHTGLYFEEQTTESLNAAVSKFESLRESFDSMEIATHATQFSKQSFKRRFAEFVNVTVKQKNGLDSQ